MVILLSLLLVVGFFVLRLLGNGTTAVIPPRQQCRATAQGVDATVSLEQAGNAAIIVAESVRRSLPPRAASIALATALQESGLRNIDYGDRDSIGLFQQRPSQGWGTVEDIMDPWYSAGRFYQALVKIPSWDTGSINDVAQKVQRSGVPDGYRKHETRARVLASALTGHSAAAVSCIDRQTGPGSLSQTERVLREGFTGSVRISTEGTSLALESTDEVALWSAVQIAMFTTESAGIVNVRVGEQTWANDTKRFAEWKVSPAPSSQQAVITVRS